MFSSKEIVDITLELMLGTLEMDFGTMRSLMTAYEALEQQVEDKVLVIEQFEKTIDQLESMLLSEMEKDKASGDSIAAGIARYETYIENIRSEITLLLAQQSLLRLGVDNYINQAEALLAPEEQVAEAEEDAEADFMTGWIDELLTDNDEEDDDLEPVDLEESVEECAVCAASAASAEQSVDFNKMNHYR